MIIGPGIYSKDPNLVAEGIVLTLPVQFFKDRKMTTEKFKPMFERYMQRDDAIWNFRLTNLPTEDNLITIHQVYLIFDKHVQYKCHFVQIERNVSKRFVDSTDKQNRSFKNANWVLLTGPAVKPPKPFPLRGFQGFRYSTNLF